MRNPQYYVSGKKSMIFNVQYSQLASNDFPAIWLTVSREANVANLTISSHEDFMVTLFLIWLTQPINENSIFNYFTRETYNYL